MILFKGLNDKGVGFYCMAKDMEDATKCFKPILAGGFTLDSYLESVHQVSRSYIRITDTIKDKIIADYLQDKFKQAAFPDTQKNDE